MSEQIRELLDVPRDFLREGTQLLNRCTKPDKREFIRISQAVGVGFIVMGAIGYFVKLSTWPFREMTLRVYRTWRTSDRYYRILAYLSATVHIPVNNILVGGA